MNLNSHISTASVSENGDLKFSFFLGKDSKSQPKIVCVTVKEKNVEKLIEDMMRVVWEKKLK